MAETADFSIDQGSTWNRQVKLTDDNGVAINLTGFTARMMLKRKRSETTPVLSLTTGAGLTITPLTGIIDIALTAAQTALLSGVYVYDFEIVSGTQVKRLFQGKIVVDDEVTR